MFNTLHQDDRWWLCKDGTSVARFGRRCSEVRAETGESLYFNIYDEPSEEIWSSFIGAVKGFYDFDCPEHFHSGKKR